MKIRACLITLFIAGVAAFECDCERRGEIPLMFEEHESKFCQMKSFSQKFTEALKKASCENPRDTVVHLDSGDPSVEYVPRAVTVKRCAGFCSLYLTCAPKEKVLVEFGVYQKRVGDSTHTCGTIHVEEHVRCRCQCKVQESHCNEFQQCMECSIMKEGRNGY
ncbi:uncharacterized protein [Periplaneta americana]|uniref:uncharacterized protein isoform X2 n=1 Tax=Periplaneta americana TaxID=6978 RepID=UPI0037E71AAF